MDRILAPLLLLAILVPAQAKEAPPAAQNPVLEDRVMALAAELRCLVCQNQTLADSNAELATDLRREIREKMTQGASDSEIVDFMVARYGDFVLYRPPFKATTALLWLGPLLLLAAGVWVLLRRILRTRPTEDAEVPPEERERAASLLAGGDAERR